MGQVGNGNRLVEAPLNIKYKDGYILSFTIYIEVGPQNGADSQDAHLTPSTPRTFFFRSFGDARFTNQ